MKKRNGKVALAYLGIAFVVLTWGLSPSAKKALIGDSFSASIYSTVPSFSAALVLFALSFKKLKLINRDYFKIAVPTGMCISVAALLQALAYNFDSSPINQAFLENLSCLTVPLILFLVTKKRPTLITVSACVLCLVSSMILSGVFGSDSSFNSVDILNALAGILYGVNIAVTGIAAKKYSPQLYVMIQLFVQTVFSGAMTVAFNFLSIGGSRIDPFIFKLDPWLILAVVLIGIFTKAVCWTIRTSAMKYVSANIVAVVMPLSAVVTGVFAVLVGQDTLSSSLVIGGIIGLVASFTSSAGDILERNRDSRKEKIGNK